MVITSAHIPAIVALIAGVLILIMPRLLNFIVAIYLILIGLVGLEAGVRRPEDTVVSVGQYCIPGTTFCRRDDQRGGAWSRAIQGGKKKHSKR